MTQHSDQEETIRAGQPRQQEQPGRPEDKDEQAQKDDEETDDDKLDEAIEMTFPASDPVSI